MKRLFSLLLILSAFIAVVSCADKDKDSAFDVQFSVPEELDIDFDVRELSFRVMFGKAPLETDEIVLVDPMGASHVCKIISVSSSSFTIALYEGMTSGEYKVSIQRGAAKRQMGTMKVYINYNTGSGDLDIELDDDTNIYGLVACGSTGVPGVVVSDGFETAVTDDKGYYQLSSSRKHGYVFISVPSGYKAVSEGVIPKLHARVSKSASKPQRVDFALETVSGQDNHTMLIFGDLHMANRVSDDIQFSSFIADVNEVISSTASENIYALTLGDMTWELYWIDNGYGYKEYIKDINRLNNIQVFNTIGNHDHDMAEAGDFDTVIKYKETIAPTYYSFNIGKVHYVVLDNIDCKNTGANTSDSRDYDDNLVQEQLNWLKKDLSYVSKSTPVVIAMHAPLYNNTGGNSLNNAAMLEDIVKDFAEVHVWTGHTHKMYNVDKLGEKNIFEHNAGAVCATWWWTWHETKSIHLAQDGAPGGYSIVNVAGDDFEWQFKPTGKPVSHQFRTYDRNSIALSSADYTPNANDWYKIQFDNSVGEWKNGSTSNYVYINVWNYDTDWEIEVTENGKTLNVEQVKTFDPLHLISYNATRSNKNAGLTFGTSETRHMFRVQASAPNTTLDIKVTDRFGNVYKETMKRPKAFTLKTYE